MCVCVCVEMIDCGKSDSMIEICGRLDKSNTYIALVLSAIVYSFFNEISRILLNLCKCLIHPTFHLFLYYIYELTDTRKHKLVSECFNLLDNCQR